MTEFKKEYIRSVRMCSYLIEPPASEVIGHLCDEIEHLQTENAKLEEALAKIANYESMRFRLSPYEYGLLEQIVGIAEHALKDGE